MPLLPAPRRLVRVPLTALLALSVLGGALTGGGGSAAADDAPEPVTVDVLDHLVARYLLDEASGGVAADSSGNGRDGAVEGTPSWNAGGGFRFGGGTASSGNAIKLPDNLIAGLQSITVSMDVKVDPSLTASHFVYNLGNGAVGTPQSGTGYLFTTTRPYLTKISNAAWGAERTTSTTANLATNVWRQLTYTQTGTTGTLYLDGVQVAQNTGVTWTPADIGGGITTKNYIGRSAYTPDASYKGLVRDFRVYDRALSGAEVGLVSTASADEYVEAQIDALAAPAAAPVTDDLALPATTPAGEAITWTSSDPRVVSGSGRVIRPSGTEDAVVTLTATTALRGESASRDFDVTVEADPDAATRTGLDVAAVDLGDLDGLTQSLLLPSVGEHGSTLAWTTSDPGVVSATGRVTRPPYGAADATAELTVTATLDGRSATRTLPVRVLAADRSRPEAGVTTRVEAGALERQVPWGSAPVVTARVLADDGAETPGTVTFRAGDWSTTRTLADGAATVALPAATTRGDRTVAVTYSGHRGLAGSTGIAAYTVAGTDTRLSLVALTPATLAGRAGRATVRVTSPIGQPTGAVTVRSGDSVLGSGTLDARGRVSVPLTGPVGIHQLQVSYAGDTRYAPASAGATWEVRRAASRLRLRLHDDVARLRLVASDSVRAAARDGRVVVRVSRADRVVAVRRVRLSAAGVAAVRLPATASGRYVVTARFSGTAAVAPAPAPAVRFRVAGR